MSGASFVLNMLSENWQASQSKDKMRQFNTVWQEESNFTVQWILVCLGISEIHFAGPHSPELFAPVPGFYLHWLH